MTEQRSGRLAGKVVAITGAAREGASLALLDRDKAALDRAVRAVPRDGAGALAVPVDIAELGSVSEAFDAVTAAFGRLDDLFNNAGVAQRNHTGPDDRGRSQHSDVPPEHRGVRPRPARRRIEQR